MEELKNTDVLDREILEDAREKAAKILSDCRDNLVKQKEDWDKKLEMELLSIREHYSVQSENVSLEIFARLPVDQRRMRSEASEKLLLKAMDDFLHSLPREKLLLILERELVGRLRSWAGNREETILEIVTAEFSGMSREEAEAVLRKIPESGNWEIRQEAEAASAFAAAGASPNAAARSIAANFPSITINTQSMKINASVKSAAAAILKAKRAELSSSLLGEGVLND